MRWGDAGSSFMKMPPYTASLVGHGWSVAACGGQLGLPAVCQANHDLKRSILVRWLLAGEINSLFG